jgi:Domain of unknown function (DUF5671)
MAANEELIAFVRDALIRGVSRAEVEAALKHAGWDARQVSSALAAFALVDFPIPVPRPRTSLSARDAFMYLLLFSTLYVVAFQFGRLVFEFINQAFPDPASSVNARAWRESIRFAVASLIVALPVFLYMSRLTNRATALDPAIRVSPVRRWLTYVTLFIAASVLIGDFTTLVYSLLGGELTVRFVLKVITVGVSDLRLDERERAA